MDVIYFKTQAEFHDWLLDNQGAQTEVYVGFYKKAAKQSGITYAEALDEALCFGWIDGIRKRIDDDRFTIRFTPRKARSIWSDVNIKRVGELTEMGLMQPSGLSTFNGRDQKMSKQYSFENEAATLDAAQEEIFRANTAAWDYFQAQAAYYKRTALWWVVSAKREDTRHKRLLTLIEHSSKNERLPQVTYQKKGKE